MISVIRFPYRLVSVANTRDHWSVKSRRFHSERRIAEMACRSAFRLYRRDDVRHVVLTRMGPRALDDDNLASAFKAVRDGVADALGVDDGDPRVTYSYAQVKSRIYEIHIEFQFDFGEAEPKRA